MRYIVNANNYITAVSFGCYVECNDDGCTEYTGSVPKGYTSLEDWYADEAEQLYRWMIVNGNLTLNSAMTPPTEGTVPRAPQNNNGEADANLIDATGFYMATANLMADSGWSYVLHVKVSAQNAMQLAFDLDSQAAGSRRKVNGTWSAWRDISPDAFAPNGYGLGEYAANLPALSDANTATKTGHYKMDGSTVNGVGASATLIVDGYGSTYARQTAVRASGGHVQTRTCVNGTWGAWEWVNPPMALGTEYRTVERWNNSAVYVRALNAGYVSAGSNAIAHGCAMKQPLTVEAYNNNVEVVTGYSGITSLTCDGTNVHMTCSNDFGNITFYLKYTK